jgi:hypothetical protein
MIKTEQITINNRVFIRTYSDSGYLVERDGVCYSEAIDPVEFGRTYTETDELFVVGSETNEGDDV